MPDAPICEINLNSAEEIPALQDDEALQLAILHRIILQRRTLRSSGWRMAASISGSEYGAASRSQRLAAL